jgi:CBS domain-containing protein
MTRMPIQDAPSLSHDDTIASAVRRVLDSGLPALPVVDGTGALVGLFGEREFLGAIFPGYVGQLGYAGFVSGELDEVLAKRAACAQEAVSEHMNKEHVSVQDDFSDVGLAEIFLHHRVIVVPVERDGQPAGVVTRSAFFERLGESFLGRSES